MYADNKELFQISLPSNDKLHLPFPISMHLAWASDAEVNVDCFGPAVFMKPYPFPERLPVLLAAGDGIFCG